MLIAARLRDQTPASRRRLAQIRSDSQMTLNLKRLQDRAAAVSARMKELADAPERTEEQTTELRRLVTESDALKGDLEFEKMLADKEAQLRSIVEPATPAPEAAPAGEPKKKVEIRAIHPHHTTLKAFNDSPEAVDQAYRCGRWISATVFRRSADILWCRENGLESRALSEGVNTAGGALVPEEFAQRVIRLVETYGTFPLAAENVTMTRDTMVIPKRMSGSTAYFIAEGQLVPESDPQWSNVSLVAKKLGCGCRMSSEVAEDAFVNLGDSVAAEFSTNLAFTVDNAGWIGDGTSTYGGITGIVPKINDGTRTASVVTAATGNVSFETLDIEDFLNVIGKLPLYARAGAAWYVSPAGYAASIARLKYAGGGNTVDSIGGDAGLSFLGYPVKLVHVMNSTLGSDVNKVKVLFGNMGLSSIYAKRRDFQVKLYDQVYATTDQLLLQGTMRFDINHHTLGSTTEVGPVIALKTAAS